ncbi:MAG: DUF1385 domain-containing protein [Armatimonadetes bacterium]|nr:DUF1385 domain-containing protein [Armatimonadota bacterium]
MAEEKHFYGGQALMEGVMMRGTDVWGAAVKRRDGTIAVIRQGIWDLTHRYRWAKWPLIRGNVALIDTLNLGVRSLIFSFNVLVEEQMEQERREQEAAATQGSEVSSAAESKARRKRQKAPKKQADTGWLAWAAMLPSLALGVGLFIILPTRLVDWLPFVDELGPIGKNCVEGVVRLAGILGYIAAISLLPDIRRIFEYHGAEHATINCYEDGKQVTLENCRDYSPLHPRCGTAFLLVFIAVKILVGIFLGWPDFWLRMVLRVATIPIVAAVAYEIIRYGGRHRDSLVARVLAQPGLLMQRLTTRQPSDEQIRVAIYALSTVAPEVPLPAGFPAPTLAAPDGKLLPEVAAPVPVSPVPSEE